MDYGFETFRGDTSVVVDGSTRGGVFLEVLNIPPGANGSKSYNNVVANALLYYMVNPGDHQISIDADALGHGRLNWSSPNQQQITTTIYVFATKIIDNSTYGINILNQLGEVLASPNYTTSQFIQKLSFKTTPDTVEPTVDGYTLYTHTTNSFNIQPNSNKVVLLSLPDTGVDDTWYSCKEGILANAGANSVTLRIYSIAANYKLPDIYLYAIDNPLPGNNPFAAQLFDATGKLTYDSSCENIGVKNAISLNYPDLGYTTSFSISPSLPGMTVPSFEIFQFKNVSGTITTDEHMAVMRRAGSQVNVKYIHAYHNRGQYVATGPFNIGSKTNRFCPVIDISALGYTAPLVITPPGYPVYHNPADNTVSNFNEVSFTISGPDTYDSQGATDYWAKGAGDSSLYEAMYTCPNYPKGQGFNDTDIWYGLQYDITWGIPYSYGTSYYSGTVQIRFKASKQVVATFSLGFEIYSS